MPRKISGKSILAALEKAFMLLNNVMYCFNTGECNELCNTLLNIEKYISQENKIAIDTLHTRIAIAKFSTSRGDKKLDKRAEAIIKLQSIISIFKQRLEE